MGLGRFGGGVGAVRFLVERGAQVTVTDSASRDDLSESLAELEGLYLCGLHLGGHREDDFLDADLIVVNPAVKRDNEFLYLAIDAGIPLTSEMSIFFQHNPARTIGVTGSNGKSTTAALIHSILQAAGMPSRLGGNIGGSLLPVVDSISGDEWIVLELSSFQLEDLERLPASPDVAVVTNFSPNHLDWHGSLEEYRKAKQAILRWQTPEGIAVLNAADADVADWGVHGQRLYFGETIDETSRGRQPSDDQEAYADRSLDDVLNVDECLALPGDHNRDNALAAVCACRAIGVCCDAIRAGLRAFKPLPHRLELVGDVAGRRYYNDSLATTPESALAALTAFDAPVVLLAGGYDKQVDLTPLVDGITQGVKAVALMGQTALLLDEMFDERGGRSVSRAISKSFDEAFRWAVEQSDVGDVVLLSPGCASYDWFRNFSDRGLRFVELVDTLRTELVEAPPEETSSGLRETI
jgi:UDP-N-acetylmuramoylalanine--D-glutamate ligase